MYTDPASLQSSIAATSPVRAVPHASELTSEASTEIRVLVNELLEQSGGLYLTITANTDCNSPEPQVCCHDGFWRTVRSPLDNNDAILERLSEAALPVIEKLAASWPPNARPRRVGFMTDGSGAAFSPDLPCPDVEGWPAMLLNGSARRIDLIRFAPRSSWSLMAIATTSTQ